MKLAGEGEAGNPPYGIGSGLLNRATFSRRHAFTRYATGGHRCLLAYATGRTLHATGKPSLSLLCGYPSLSLVTTIQWQTFTHNWHTFTSDSEAQSSLRVRAA